MKIDKVYIINVRSKQEDLQKRINDLNLPYRFKWEIVVGVYGTETNQPWNPYVDWKIDSKNDWWNRRLLKGEVGCALSHYNVWKKAHLEGWNNVLILEEDFVIKNSLKDLLLPKEFDGFYLGRNKVEEDKKNYDDNYVVPGYSYNTHAYCLSKTGINKLLKYNFNKNIIPVDEFLSATFTKHPRRDIALLYKPTLNFLATKKEYIDQKSNEKTSMTENSKSISQFKQSNFEILDYSDWENWKQKYINPIVNNGEYELVIDHLGNEVYEFPLFTKKFCNEIIAMGEELDNWTYERHKYYPTTDVLLEDIGMNVIYNKVLNEIVRPLCIYIWTLEGIGWDRIVSENFLVKYLPDAQSHLAIHHDHSHLSLVVKLNDEFDGGGTYFPKYNLLSNPERAGTATIHPGQITHRHGARPIHSGRRYITVSFIKQNLNDI